MVWDGADSAPDSDSVALVKMSNWERQALAKHLNIYISSIFELWLTFHHQILHYTAGSFWLVFKMYTEHRCTAYKMHITVKVEVNMLV